MPLRTRHESQRCSLAHTLDARRPGRGGHRDRCGFRNLKSDTSPVRVFKKTDGDGPPLEILIDLALIPFATFCPIHDCYVFKRRHVCFQRYEAERRRQAPA